MALTRRDLELMDQRRVLQARATDEAGTGFTRSQAKLALRNLDKQIARQAEPAKQPNKVVPLPEPRNGPPVGTKPGVENQPSPLVPTVPPEAEKIANSPITAPTMDDAARDAAAATPLDPVAKALGQPPKRKKYGSATTALTGETGLGNVGNIASRVLLG